ncbi:TonB-dependent receptor [Thalassotalea psychrophila]|uniref:TonB-dependent receptor n=1 Tax=Thalassotalea psychrophila TaxID=3065647 RepID=A0ABY9TPJ2_9GAMM|nr:TonB-dependent receptor [Colwelliaceae bacterium SQ149]
MKKTIIATTLISIGISASFSQQAIAANVDTDDQMLVTANRSQQEQFLALSANSVITSEQIKTMQVGNISELLDTVAGVSVVQQGGSGQNTSIFMRGTNSNHTLILVDGVRINSATLGTTNLTAISPSQIERIEIVKGPRAALWGSDAIGGVIQIFTKQLHSGEGSLTVGAGSNGLIQADAAMGLGNDKHNISISVSTESSDGFNAYTTDPYPYDINEDDDDGYERFSVSAVGNSQLTNTMSLHLVSRFESGNSEFDASYPDSPCWFDEALACPAYYANEQDHENYSVKLASRYQGDNLFSELAIATSQDEAENFGNETVPSTISTERNQVSFINQYQFLTGTSFSLGLDYYVEEISNSEDLDGWVPGFQTWDEVEREVSAVFLQAQHQQDKLLLEGAVRHDDIENLDAETTYNASVGYQINDNWLVSVTRGTGFKAPTFNDLYWPGSGNPDLQPEKITNNEVLIRHQFSSDSLNAKVELSAFDSEIDNLIAWAPNEFGLWQPANINSAEISGVEASIMLNVGNINNQLNLAFVDAEDSVTGDKLLRRPELTATYSLGYHWQNFSFNSLVSYRDESVDAGEAKLDSYVLVDLGVSYHATNNITLNARVNNIFDEEYQTSLNYFADGTNYKASVSYSF